MGGRNATEHAVMHAMSQRGGSKVVGFKGANHGHGLAFTQFAHPEMSNTSLNWPCVDFPQSNSDESKALEKARSEMRAGGVSAVVIEPTNWQTGAAVSDNFINELGSIAHESEAALIVDETNTGCGASGKGFWQYQGHAADYLSFGRRT